MFRLPAVLLAITVLSISGCKRAVPENVAATVNGRVITYADLDKQYQTQFMSSPEHPSDDQMMIQKLEVLRTLVDNEIMLQRAEKLGLMATDADVESKFTELKAPFTQEEFQKQLASRKMSAEDFKAQLKRDLSIQKLFNKEITSHISISDHDVSDFYNSNKSSFNFPEPQVHVAQILVTPTPDPNVRNLKGDKAQNEDQARKKMDMLLARLKQGEDFGVVAQNFSEDPTYAPNGGDLGFVPESALEKANPDIRKAIQSATPGQMTPIVHTSEGYRVFKVFSKEPAGQRELTDPRVQQNIRETLLNRKDQLLRAAYYEVARDEAKVVNYLAMTVAQAQEKK
ncbi:MAG TPA: SurA N-terminal domain-containing protein [Bryobacteraceae bacterium]|jgi:peptidyl-prolyl cis-trans isomerase SurA|nr:SurA N-terminal domain-containing protein [Bryobacteraceae bacterium]